MSLFGDGVESKTSVPGGDDSPSQKLPSVGWRDAISVPPAGKEFSSSIAGLGGHADFGGICSAARMNAVPSVSTAGFCPSGGSIGGSALGTGGGGAAVCVGGAEGALVSGAGIVVPRTRVVELGLADEVVGGGGGGPLLTESFSAEELSLIG